MRWIKDTESSEGLGFIIGRPWLYLLLLFPLLIGCGEDEDEGGKTGEKGESASL